MSIVKINHNTKVVGVLKVISLSSTAPLYTISRSGVSTTEGFTISYTINSLNVAGGTSVPYVISGITPEDLSSGSLSGNLIIDNNGTSTLSLTLEDDGIPEGIETITLYVGSVSSSIDVADTSYSDTYTLNRSTEFTDEGTTVTYTINSTIASVGAVIPYIITGISQEDLSSGSITGNFVLDSNKESTISLTLANDFLTEGTETITIVADGRVQTTDVNDTSTNPNAVLLLNGNGEDGSSNSLIRDSSIYQNNNNGGLNRLGTPTLTLDDLTNSPSVYFDGSGDFYKLDAGYASQFQFPSGTFTVEAWVKFDTVANYSNTARYIISNYSSSTTGWAIGIYNAKLIALLTGDAADITGTTTLLPNVWYHVALCGSTGSYKLFLNGIKQGNTYTGATRLDGGAVGIGAITRTGYVGSAPFKGYIKGIRVTKNVNLYTEEFPNNLPTTPFNAVNNDDTILLINPSSPNIVDSTSKNKLIITEGNSEITTTNFKYGTGSLYFDGSGDGLKIPANADLALGIDDFTIEFWCNFTDTWYNAANTTVTNCNRTIIAQGFNTNATIDWQYRYRIIIDAQTNRGNAVGGISFLQSNTTGCKTVVAVNDGQWHHIAFTRSGGVLRCFVDGILKSTVNNNTDFKDITTAYTIGRQGADSTPCGFYKGYLDDFRIVKNIALYTQNFTPPTEGLTA